MKHFLLITSFALFAPSLMAANPPEVPIYSTYHIKCTGLEYKSDLPLEFEYIYDPNSLDPYVEVNAKLGDKYISDKVIELPRTDKIINIKANDFYGNGEILNFTGEQLIIEFTPAYNPPLGCLRCSPGHESIYYSAIKYLGLSLYKKFPYDSDMYESGHISIYDQNKNLEITFKKANCQISIK